MKIKAHSLQNNDKECSFLSIFCLSSLLLFSPHAFADVTVVTIPRPFPPGIPTLEADDAFISYTYNLETTGWWSFDYEHYTGGVVQGVNESWSRKKNDGSVVLFSRSANADAGGRTFYCPGWQSYVWFLYNGCTNSDCAEIQNPPGNYGPFCQNCMLGSRWFVASDGQLGVAPGDNDITEGPTTVPVACGTLITGKSAAITTIGPWDARGACPFGVQHIFIHGGEYKLDLTITRDCIGGPVGQDFAAYENSASLLNMVGSASPLTPTSQSFDSNGRYTFTFGASANVPQYIILSSSNLIDWNICGTATPSGGTATFTDSEGSGSVFYRIEETPTSLSDDFGAIELSLPAGYSMIANPLLSRDLTIGALLPNVPNGTALYFLHETEWDLGAIFSSGTWDRPDRELIPGEGAMICLPVPATVRFTGEVIQGGITNPIPAGYSVRSSFVPQSGPVNSLGITGLNDGDFIRKWNGRDYATYTYSSGSWSPTTPVLSIGESFIVHAASATNWNRVFTNYSDPFTKTPLALDYCWDCNSSPHWAEAFYVYWDGYWDCSTPPPAEGGALDLYLNGYFYSSISWDGRGPIWLYEFGDAGFYDQGSVFQVRYRNGASVGNLSNELPEWVSWDP